MHPFVDSHQLENKLKALPFAGQFAFILLICERMMVGLRKFGYETGFDIKLYESCILDGWSYMDTPKKSEEYITLADLCVEKAPDPEEFSSPLRSAAFDAAISVGNMLRFLADGKRDEIISSAELAFDTISMHIDLTSQKFPVALTLQELRQHPRIQLESALQSEDLQFLLTIKDLDVAEQARLLKTRSQRSFSLIQ